MTTETIHKFTKTFWVLGGKAIVMIYKTWTAKHGPVYTVEKLYAARTLWLQSQLRQKIPAHSGRLEDRTAGRTAASRTHKPFKHFYLPSPKSARIGILQKMSSNHSSNSKTCGEMLTNRKINSTAVVTHGSNRRSNEKVSTWEREHSTHKFAQGHAQWKVWL